MGACSQGLEEQCCLLIVLPTGVSCFTVSPHPCFVRSCMPVHVQICLCAFLEHSLFYTSPGQVFLSFDYHLNHILMLQQQDKIYWWLVSVMSQHAVIFVMRLFKAQGTLMLVISAPNVSLVIAFPGCLGGFTHSHQALLFVSYSIISMAIWKATLE